MLMRISVSLCALGEINFSASQFFPYIKSKHGDNTYLVKTSMDFPGGTVVKNSPASSGDAGSIPESGRSPGVGNGHPLQCFCLEKDVNRVK